MPLTFSAIDISRRRQKPGSGSLDLKPRTSAWLTWPDLTPVLAPIPWAVVGAVATRLYMPERMTSDIDIVVAAGDAERTRARLQTADFKFGGELSIGRSGWQTADGVRLDLVEATESWWRQAIEEAQENPDQQGFPTLPLPYLVLVKLLVSRLQDVADVSRMLGVASDDQLQRVRQVVRKHAPGLSDDLEAIVIQGRLETVGGTK